MRPIATTAVLLAAVLSVGATKPAATKPAATRPAADWGATVAVTPAGTHVIGNPAAQVKITEFLSYTCSHCADFHKESEGPLRISYVPAGKVAVEVQHLIRDPVDLSAAMLASCAGPAKFYRVHNAILQKQTTWIGLMGKASSVQKQRWSTGPVPQRLQAIANDFGFYKIMESAGFNQIASNRCLADEATAKRLLDQTDAALKAGVSGTPSFMLNGQLLGDTHDWKALEAEIRKHI